MKGEVPWVKERYFSARKEPEYEGQSAQKRTAESC